MTSEMLRSSERSLDLLENTTRDNIVMSIILSFSLKPYLVIGKLSNARLCPCV